MTSTIRKDSLLEDSDVAMPSASEIFAQWGAASAAGLNDLSDKELMDQLYLGQLHEEPTKEKKPKGKAKVSHGWAIAITVCVLLIVIVYICFRCYSTFLKGVI